MNKIKYLIIIILIFAVILTAFLDRDSVLTTNTDGYTNRTTIVIDAGHGGEDGGAISCTGISESHLNLEIAMKLNHLLHLLGWKTHMIRTDDISVYTEGTSLSHKKISDLKERVRIVNATPNAFLISIHQNYYPDNRYWGAQTFYAPTIGSKSLAEYIQKGFLSTINQGSKRNIKPADNIYLMQNVTCPAILLECGFISNFKEEVKLRDPVYQRNISAIIAAAITTNVKDLLLT